MRKRAIVSSSPQGMTSWSSSSIKIVFFKYIICHGVKQNAKICVIGEQNVRDWRTKNLSEEKEGMVEREKREN